MEDDGVGILIRKTFVPADNLISALQVERARVVSEQLRVTYNDWLTDVALFFFSHGLEHHLRTDSRRVAHGDADPRSRAGSAGIRRTLKLIIHRSKRTAHRQTLCPPVRPERLTFDDGRHCVFNAPLNSLFSFVNVFYIALEN